MKLWEANKQIDTADTIRFVFKNKKICVCFPRGLVVSHYVGMRTLDRRRTTADDEECNSIKQGVFNGLYTLDVKFDLPVQRV